MKFVIPVALYAILSISFFSPRAIAASRIPKWAESLDSIVAELSNVEKKQENFSKKADEIASHCMPNRYENFTNQHNSNKETLYKNAKYLKKEI
ncbi:MAG: hypothetical protein M9962_01810 [Oligoflexia bacterium]|nr:hypothetical protein [Oligoflexia bacterium]